jgi:2-C-methyl-D-erythritol 4-phosphate cytidylyltransferase
VISGIVLAAGRGERFGGPKHLVDLGGRTLLAWSVATVRAVADDVLIVGAVLPEGVSARTVDGGTTRAESVRAGLGSLTGSGVVLVHDAAHPLASVELARRVLAPVLDGAAGAVPVLAATETLVALDGEAVAGRTLGAALPRGHALVQMPQAYDVETLRRAHDSPAVAQDDSGLLRALGVQVVTVEGEPTNIHITTSADLEMARALKRGLRPR